VTPSWWTGLPPLEETIPCGDADHRIRWSAGELATPDHDDPDGERTLAALGGQATPCIEVLDAWQRHREDLDVLLLASRGAADPLDGPFSAARGGPAGPTAPARPVAPMAVRPGPLPAGWFGLGGTGVAGRATGGVVYGSGPGPSFPSPVPIHGAPPNRVAFASSASFAGSGGSYSSGLTYYAPGPGPAQPGDPLLLLLGLPGGLPHRLVATVIATWTQRITDGDPRVAEALPALHAALYGRALAAIRGWLGGGPVLDVRLAAEPAAVRQVDGVIGVELPFSWLRDVWARGFATLAGRFCLTAQPGPPNDWIFTAVAPDFGQPQRFTLQTG